MMEDYITNDDLKEAIWHDANERLAPPKRMEPPVDDLVSRIVGKKIYAQDPRLLKLIVSWKQGKDPDSMEPDHFLDNPKKIEELKRVLGGELK